MADPRRLTAGGDDLGSAELTRWLIDSARHEEPATEALQRTLLAAGATSAVLAAATTTGSATAASAASSGAVSSTGVAGTAAVASGSAVGAGALSSGAAGGVAAGKAAGLSVLGAASKVAAVKWLAVSLVGGATVVGAGSKLIAPSPVATAPAAVELHQPTPSAEREPAKERQQAAPGSAGQSAANKPIATPSTPAVAPAPREPAVDPEVTEVTTLHKEVKLIDRAREAKAAGQHARVVALSQEYLASFPRGRLLPEAISLKMESEDALGRTHQAAQTARMLLRVAPNSPQAKRARELSAPASAATP